MSLWCVVRVRGPAGAEPPVETGLCESGGENGVGRVGGGFFR